MVVTYWGKSTIFALIKLVLMKRILICLCFILAAVSCSRQEKELKERALELCNYIPDHVLKPEAEDFMTPEFFKTLSEAWDAPDIDFDGPGYGEWLLYFVTGNGGGKPLYAVKSVSLKSKEEAHAVITVRIKDDLSEYVEPEEQAREYGIVMKLVDDKWLLDDFDNKKAECIDYIKEQRAKCESGELLEALESYEFYRTFIPEFKKRVEAYYQKYGK